MERKRHGLLLALGFLFFAVVSGLQLTSAAIEDEIEFAKVAWAWFDQGPSHFGLWHTPFYLESLVLWQKLLALFWGHGADPKILDSIGILRSFGLFCGVATAGLFYFGLKKNKLDSFWALIFTLLLLTHSFFV